MASPRAFNGVLTCGGVADGACFTIVGGPIAAMYVLKASDLMSINIQAGIDTTITPDALIALGKIAAGRL